MFGPKRDEVTKLSGEDCIMRNSVTCTVLRTKYYSDDRIKKNEMAGGRSTCGREMLCVQGFGGET